MIVALGVAVGCGEDREVRVAVVPKEPAGAREVPPFVQMVMDGGSGGAVGATGEPMGAPMGTGEASVGDARSSRPVSAGPSIRGEWEVPAGWSAIEPAPPPAAYAFALEATPEAGDADPLVVTVTALPGTGGGLLANVNRWRRQLSLPPIGSPDELELDLIEMARAAPSGANRTNAPGAVPAIGLDMTDPDATTRTLAAVWPDPSRGATWFFKLTGPADPVAQAAEDFRRFVGSTRPLDAAPNPAPATAE
jgi:hypothetical protein